MVVRGCNCEPIRLQMRPAANTTGFPLKEKAGSVVSNFLHDHGEIGFQLEAMPPRVSFHLDDESALPIVLLPAGIGVTWSDEKPLLFKMLVTSSARVKTQPLRSSDQWTGSCSRSSS